MLRIEDKAIKSPEKFKKLSSRHYFRQTKFVERRNVLCNIIVLLHKLTGHFSVKTTSKYMVGIPRYGFSPLNWYLSPERPSDKAMHVINNNK